MSKIWGVSSFHSTSRGGGLTVDGHGVVATAHENQRRESRALRERAQHCGRQRPAAVQSNHAGPAPSRGRPRSVRLSHCACVICSV